MIFLRSRREMRLQGKILLAKLERKTREYRESQLTKVEIH